MITHEQLVEHLACGECCTSIFECREHMECGECAEYHIREYDRQIVAETVDEISTLAVAHSVDIPVRYGDGTEGTDAYISLTELRHILSEITDGGEQT